MFLFYVEAEIVLILFLYFIMLFLLQYTNFCDELQISRICNSCFKNSCFEYFFCIFQKKRDIQQLKFQHCSHFVLNFSVCKNIYKDIQANILGLSDIEQTEPHKEKRLKNHLNVISCKLYLRELIHFYWMRARMQKKPSKEVQKKLLIFRKMFLKKLKYVQC